MKKPLLVSLIVVVAIVASVGYLMVSKSTEQGTSTTKVTDQQSPAIDQTASRGKYIDYKDGVIASTKGTKLLFFHAAWCPQCVALDADIEKQGLPKGVVVIKVDYDSQQSLRQKYGVTLQTTVVRVDDEGELVAKFVAYDDPTIASVLEKLL